MVPLEHALIFYLQDQGVGFSYHFIWPFFHPTPDPTRHKWATEFESKIIEYPHSMMLADDLADLCAAGVLSLEKESPTTYVLGNLAKEHKKYYLDFFTRVSDMSYDNLKDNVQGALESPKRLFEECYKIYIKNI